MVRGVQAGICVLLPCFKVIVIQKTAYKKRESANADNFTIRLKCKSQRQIFENFLFYLLTLNPIKKFKILTQSNFNLRP